MYISNVTFWNEYSIELSIKGVFLTFGVVWCLFGGRSSTLPTDWHVLILCIIFRLENLYFRVKWYVEYSNVLLNLISQWNLCQYITFYRNHNFV